MDPQKCSAKAENLSFGRKRMDSIASLANSLKCVEIVENADENCGSSFVLIGRI